MRNMDDDTQVKLAAALTRISSLEREVDTKQRLLEDAAAETERVRDGLERLIKELVAKNRTMDDQLRRVQAQHEQEMTDVLHAHERTVADLTDTRKQNSVLRESQSTLHAQLATNAAINRDMAEELEVHKARRQAADAALAETQRAMEDLRHSEQDARSDVDDLIVKLQRADQHLVQLTEEATAASVTASRLKAHAQQLQAERDAAQRATQELTARIKAPSQTLAEQVRQLMRDVDSALRDAQNVIDGKSSGARRSPSTAHRSATPAWMDGADGVAGQLHAPRLWPSNAEGLDDASCIVLALQRVSDVVPVLSEDIALVRRTINESLRREGDEQQQLNVVRDALNAERSHVAELADAARNSAELLKRSEDEGARLKAALADSAQWMAEAAQIGEERARRAENLAMTIRSLEAERTQLIHEVTRLREELNHAKLLSDVSASGHAGFLSSSTGFGRDFYGSSGGGGGGFAPVPLSTGLNSSGVSSPLAGGGMDRRPPLSGASPLGSASAGGGGASPSTSSRAAGGGWEATFAGAKLRK
jgi:chromosome segregation ATPase